jgi:uncharacterized membrane protein YcjF (UPF0283 family)
MPQGNTLIGRISVIVLKILMLPAFLTWSPVWIISSFLFASHRLGYAVASAAIVLVIVGMVSLGVRANSLHRLSRNPLSGIGRFLRSEQVDAA